MYFTWWGWIIYSYRLFMSGIGDNAHSQSLNCECALSPIAHSWLAHVPIIILLSMILITWSHSDNILCNHGNRPVLVVTNRGKLLVLTTNFYVLHQKNLVQLVKVAEGSVTIAAPTVLTFKCNLPYFHDICETLHATLVIINTESHYPNCMSCWCNAFVNIYSHF